MKIIHTHTPKPRIPVIVREPLGSISSPGFDAIEAIM